MQNWSKPPWQVSSTLDDIASICNKIFYWKFFVVKIKKYELFGLLYWTLGVLFFFEFQLIKFASDDSSLSLDQNTN